jgi:hypothetical protein
MEHSSLEVLRQKWQKAVSDHAGMLRDGRMSGLNAEELSELSQSYAFRIDLADARLMEAEARERLTSRPH